MKRVLFVCKILWLIRSIFILFIKCKSVLIIPPQATVMISDRQRDMISKLLLADDPTEGSGLTAAAPSLA